MDLKYEWNDQIPEKDGMKLSVNDVAFSPGMKNPYTVSSVI
jgi:hypothetical protein